MRDIKTYINEGFFGNVGAEQLSINEVESIIDKAFNKIGVEVKGSRSKANFITDLYPCGYDGIACYKVPDMVADAKTYTSFFISRDKQVKDAYEYVINIPICTNNLHDDRFRNLEIHSRPYIKFAVLVWDLTDEVVYAKIKDISYNGCFTFAHNTRTKLAHPRQWFDAEKIPSMTEYHVVDNIKGLDDFVKIMTSVAKELIDNRDFFIKTRETLLVKQTDMSRTMFNKIITNLLRKYFKH